MIRAAGIMFVTKDDRILLLRRAAGSTQPGTWCIPGGGVEEGETAEQAARREAREEIGWADPTATLTPWTRVARDGVDFTTYLCRVPQPFDVTLNEEHTESTWVPRVEIEQRFARIDPIDEEHSEHARVLIDSDIDYVPQKMSKQAVDYGPGMPARHCGICEHFQAPEACELVAGTISPSAWCEKFKL